MKLSEIIKANRELEQQFGESIAPHTICILSNITIQQLSPVLELKLRQKGLNFKIKIGDYDNIIQESLLLNSSGIYVIFWELCNAKDSIVYEIETFKDEELQAFINKTKEELKMLFYNLRSAKLVVFNKF